MLFQLPQVNKKEKTMQNIINQLEQIKEALTTSDRHAPARIRIHEAIQHLKTTEATRKNIQQNHEPIPMQEATEGDYVIFEDEIYTIKEVEHKYYTLQHVRTEITSWISNDHSRAEAYRVANTTKEQNHPREPLTEEEIEAMANAAYNRAVTHMERKALFEELKGKQ